MRRILAIARPALVVAISLVFMHSASGGTHLGATIDDFQNAWGRPTIEERIDRTARFVWGPYDHETKLPRGIREAQVQFLDRAACAILLRGRLGVHEKWSWVAKHIRQAILSCPQNFPIPERDSSGSREFSLKDGTFVAVRQFKHRTIIVINGPVLLQNEEIFSRELAKIHSPKAEH
jgi:hypothetical protein